MKKESRYEQSIVAYGLWVVRHRWWVLLSSLLLMLGLSAGVRFIYFSTDYRVYFGPDNPQLVAFDDFTNLYSKVDSVMFAVEAKDGDVFQPRVLEAMHVLTQEAWKLPYTLRVDSITNYQHTKANGDDLDVHALVEHADDLSPARAAEIRSIVMQEPLLVRRLVATDGKVAAINMVAQFPQKSEAELPATVAAARELRDRILKDYPEVGAIYLTGSNMMSNAFTEAATHDIKTLIPAMYAVIVVVMWLMLRSGSATFATMLVVLFSALTAVGCAGYLGMHLTPPSAAAPQIITTLAVADSIHVYLTFFSLLRDGKAKWDAIVESLRINFTPVLLTSATTMIGFATVNFTDSPPLRDLANITLMGVGLAWFFSVFTLPALMAVLPVKVPAARSAENSRLTALMDRLGNGVLRFRRPLFWGMIAVSLVFTVLAFKNEPNDLFAHYFDESIQFRQDTDAVVEKMTGFYYIEFNLDSGEAGGISDPAYLKTVDEFAGWWKTGPWKDKVLFVGPFTDVYKRLNKNMHGDDPAFYKVPDDRELAAQYLLLYEMSLPFGLDLNNQVSVDKSSTRFTVIFEHLHSKETRAIEQSAREWLAQRDMATIGVSPAVMFAYIAERNIRSNFISLPLSLALISLLLLPALRSVKLGLLSVIPNLLPLGIAFGLWFLIDGEIKFVQAIVLNMTLGIIVDDTIHFLSKYLRAKRELGLDTEAAIRHAFHNVGAALVVTTAILVAGFALLTQSAFSPNSSNAELTCIVLVVALIVDLLFLPPLLMLTDKKKAPVSKPSLENAREPVTTN